MATTGRSSRPWKLEVVTIDPRQIRGELTSWFGADIENRQTTSQLAVQSGALPPPTGASSSWIRNQVRPADLAGAAVFHGKVSGEPVGDHPAW